ncbi:MAG: DUF1559 domain-containing protein [Planctomycetota bacterium]
MKNSKQAMTLVETLVAISIASMFAAVALPVMQNAREEARRSQCAMQLATLANGAAMYELANGVMPPVTTNDGIVNRLTDINNTSHQQTGAIGYLLPFIGEQGIADLLVDVATRPDIILDDTEFGDFGGLYSIPEMLEALMAKPERLICPSNADYSDALVEELYTGNSQIRDSNVAYYSLFEINSTEFGRTSYLPVIGGFLAQTDISARGIDLFDHQVLGAMRNRELSIAANDLVDGTSNTIAWGESLGLILPPTAEDNETDQPHLKGVNSSLLNASIHTGHSYFLEQSILFGSSEASIHWLIGSNHPDGNNVAMYDGSVRFLNRNTSRQVAAALGCGGDGWISPRSE